MKAGLVALATVAVGAAIFHHGKMAAPRRVVLVVQDLVELPKTTQGSLIHPAETSFSAQLREQVETANAVPEEQRSQAWARRVQSFPQSELPEVLKALGSATDAPSAELRQLLVRRWTARDPWAAANWAGMYTNASVQLELLRQVALVWAQSELPQAIQWAQSLLDPEQRQSVCLTLANEAARTDPKTALTLAAGLPTTQVVNELIIHAAAQWSVDEPAEAADWARQISDSTLRDKVLSGIATEWGASDPVAAANLVLNSISAGKSQNDAVVGIVQRWAETDPETAADWVAAFPAGNLQQSALENLIKPWALEAPGQAGQWLNKLTSATVRDTAVAAYVKVIALGAPESAADWASSIAQATLRACELDKVIKVWQAKDSASTRTWIAQSSLSASERNQLLALTGN